MLNGVGIAFNVIGLALTSWGIIRESRQRQAPLIKVRERAWIDRALRKVRLGRKLESHQVRGTIAAKGDVRAHASVHRHRNPDDPIEKQLQAIEHNLAEEISGLRRQGASDREDFTKRLDDLRDRHDQEVALRSEAAQTETEIASDALRVEFVGIALALLGTTLSAMG